jgi:hypothetical protein
MPSRGLLREKDATCHVGLCMKRFDDMYVMQKAGGGTARNLRYSVNEENILHL